MEFAEVPGVLGEIGRATLASLPALQKAWPGASGSHRAPRPDGRDFLAAFRPPVEFPVIAEVKLASPSQGAIAPHLSPVEVAAQYLGAGRALSTGTAEPVRAMRPNDSDGAAVVDRHLRRWVAQQHGHHTEDPEQRQAKGDHGEASQQRETQSGWGEGSGEGCTDGVGSIHL